MKQGMRIAQSELMSLLEAHELTAGMYVRVHGDNLIIGRCDLIGQDSEPKQDDRIRLTRLNASTYGLSVRRHTGRWEKTPFSGGMKDMVDTILTFMQHLIAPY
jgi:hypothetical protein